MAAAFFISPRKTTPFVILSKAKDDGVGGAPCDGYRIVPSTVIRLENSYQATAGSGLGARFQLAVYRR